MRNPLIAARLFGQPLFAHPDKAAILAEVVLGRDAAPVLHAGGIVRGAGALVGERAGEAILPRERAGVTGDMIAGMFERANAAPFPVVDGIAVIPIEGSLVNRGAWIGAESGLVSYQGVQAQVARAAAMPNVAGVVLDFDSWGGEVQGVFETAAAIAALSKAKPTMAIVDANCCSAAYMLAAHARRVVAPEDGMVGSIGAVIMHIDRSRQLANQGVAVTFIHAGARKVEGNEAEPLADDLRARLQAKVDASRLRFAEAVAAARPGLTVAAALATEAACFTGGEALERGLVDAVAEPTATFAAFRAAVNQGR